MVNADDLLKALVAAWEALPGGYQPRKEIERWLAESMKPAIDNARMYLGE